MSKLFEVILLYQAKTLSKGLHKMDAAENGDKIKTHMSAILIQKNH